jgi:hypothetical protein
MLKRDKPEKNFPKPRKWKGADGVVIESWWYQNWRFAARFHHRAALWHRQG